jgi:DNA-directed RNA polymerase omega subunit
MAEKKEQDKIVSNQVGSKYRKILIAAARSKQIQRGARPRVTLPNAKPTRVALAEVERGLVTFDVAAKE